MTATAQTSANSTPEKQSPAATEIDREQVIARTVAEVKAGRALLAAQKTQLVALEKELLAAQANSQSLQKSYTDAEKEIASLRESIKHLEAAIEAKDQLVAELKQQRDAARRAEKKANKRAAITTVISVGLLLIRFL